MKYLLLLIILSSCISSKKNLYSKEELKKRTFFYFWDLAHETNFQIPDRYPTLTFSSIAATGFGLSSCIVGIENHFIDRKIGAERVLNTLKILYDLKQDSTSKGASGYQGFYYHFLTLDKAERFKQVELSTIDTGLLMAGILSTMTYFDKETQTEREIRRLADLLYRRVNWQWMMKSDTVMSMGWHPESGYIKSDWRGYNEAMILLIMAIGSPSHPIPPEAWKKWCSTYNWDEFYGQKNIQFDPMFGHQYSHIWIDFRSIQDSFMKVKKIDYFENSRRASLSNRAYCIKNPSKFIGYHPLCWGLTACDGPYNGEKNINGNLRTFYDYRARGAAQTNIVDDGTIAPTAAGGSYPFIPKEADETLKYMWETYYENLIGKYGFKDAFNLTYKDEKNKNGWFDTDYLGIDQGPILLQIENHDSELLWKIMRKNPYIVAGLKKAGFSGGWLNQ
jgi:hypothetical protein